MLKRSLRPISRSTARRALAEALESRLLMHGGTCFLDPHLEILDNLPPAESTTPTGTGPDLGITTNGPIAISSLPKYHSRPGAVATLFLDLDGMSAMSWGGYSVPAQSAWSADGDRTIFSDSEQQTIYQTWARVAEKFSPFGIDVTTEDPGNRTANKTLAVIFTSDNGSWLGGTYGGVAYIGSYHGGTGGNTVFIFPPNLQNNAKYMAEAAAHEAGHAFGLNHQSSWSGSTKTAEYNPGNSLVAPIMGNSYSAERGLWFNGTSASGSVQDDLSILAANNFAYAADDHGNTTSSASALAINSTAISDWGVIERMTDSDAFSFNSGAGAIQLTVNPAAYGAMLNLKLSLFDDNGTLLGSANNATFTETLNVTVNSGTYTLVVSSNGGYGDLGQYRISGTIVAPAAPTVSAPTGLAAAVSNGRINLAWNDTNSAETGYIVQRSTDGATFADYVLLGANVTTYADLAVTAGGTYSYRVLAIDATSRSAASNTATATLAPLAPATLLATAASSSQINLSWSDVSGETGFRIERSTDGVNFALLATVGAGVTSYANTGLAASTAYSYRVFATNAGGTSAASPVASATTQAAPLIVLNAPSNLTATVQKNGRVRLTWNDTNTSETGYRIEISTDGTTFSLLANVAANSTSYMTARLAGTYWFRVRAFSGTTESPYSNVAQASLGTAKGNASQGLPSVADTTIPLVRIGRAFNLLSKLPARLLG